MKRFTVVSLIFALVISITAIGCSGGGSAGPTPQPIVATPTQEPTQQPTAEPTEAPNQIGTATSLDFTLEYVTEGQGTFTYQYRARNIGTSDLDLRVDMSMPQVNAKYILKGSTHEGWAYNGQQWVEFSMMYSNWDEFWDAWYEGFENYQAPLVEGWTGVEGWTYTMPGIGTVTYTNIDINPSLPDSVFQPD